MRRVLLLASLLALAAASGDAQSVRGVIVDDSTKLPVHQVLITLVDGAGQEILPGVRSDSSGNFTVHAARPGTYRVKAVRIGYRPLTSEPVSLGIAQLAVVRLRMTTVAQQLIPVRVVERRTLTAAELMSVSGFDLRESKGLGTFLSGERLAALGGLGVGEVLASFLQPTLYVNVDSSSAGALRIRQGRTSCIPEVYLDGRLLASTPEHIVEFDSSPALLQTAGDSMRLVLRRDAENARLAAGQEYAMSVLSALHANNLHGIEVYRANQLPPPSLAGWFGVTRGTISPCGTVAVWTKRGTRRLAAAARGTPPKNVQVIAGTVVNLDTGSPIAGVPIALLSDSRDPIGDPVESDDRGEFTIRTDKAGPIRMRTGNIGFQAVTSPIIPLAADEVLIVKLFVSPTQPVLAPLAVAARIGPQTFGVSSLGGFAYRRERGLAGVFFRHEEIRRAGATTLADLMRGLPGVTVGGPAPADTITFPGGADLPRCRPAFYVNGKPLVGDTERAIGSLALDGVFGVEIYTSETDIPAVFADAGAECGLVGVWMKR